LEKDLYSTWTFRCMTTYFAQVTQQVEINLRIQVYSDM